MDLAERIYNIENSATMVVATKTSELKRKGEDIIDLVVGEPDFPTPDNIKTAAIRALETNLTKYTDNVGLQELRAAIKNKFLKEYNVQFSENEILVSNGAKQSVYNAIMAIISKGDEVIIPAPYYVSYPHMVKLAEGIPVYIPTDESKGFKISASDFQNLITYKTKMLILCNPCNPTGSVYSENELSALIKIAKEHNIFLLTDEVYEKLVFDNLKFTPAVKVGIDYKDYIITINGMSKTYAMTGWRVGYALAEKSIIDSMAKVQSHSTSGASSISQFASVEALNGPQESIDQMRREFELRRNYLHSELNKLPGIKCYKSEGAFYLFPNITDYFGKAFNGKKIQNSIDFAMFLLDEAKVAIVPGSAFGGEGFIRFSYATSMDNLKEAICRIKKSLTFIK